VTAKNDSGRMRGGIRRPRGPHGTWSFVINLGPRPSQRCDQCGHREWLRRVRLTACPKCGGSLRDTTERRQQVSGGFPTKIAALKARTEALHDLGLGVPVVHENITVGKWLTEEWLPSLELSGLRATTLDGYRRSVRLHLAVGAFGRIPLQRLSREHIIAHHIWLRDQGARGNSARPLAANTMVHIHATLHRALRDAVRVNLLARNPASDIELPKAGNEARGAKVNAWRDAELAAFLAATADDRLHALWHVLAMTGMRRGEALALRWDDIDLERGRVSISKSRVRLEGRIIETTTKTDRARVVQIDPGTVAVLRALAKAQLDELADCPQALEERLVFTGQSGSTLLPPSVSALFAKSVAKAALPKLSLHGLRHTHASLLLQAGVPAKVVQERLGHRSITITMDIYSHVTPGMDGDAALVFGRLVASAADASLAS